MNLIKKSIITLRKEGLAPFLIKLFRRISAFLLKLIIKRPKKDNWKKIKNNYKGETVYLIGNGPSLNQTPLYLLKDKKVMVFNRFNLMLERLNWNPTFYSVTDDLVLEDMIKEATEMANRSTMAFFPDISFRGNLLFKRFKNLGDNVFWLNQIGRLGFSKELPKAYSGGTVIYEGFQVLSYLGFTRIVFLGVDMDYKIHQTAKNISPNKTEIMSVDDDDPNHFDPRYFGKGKKYHQPEEKVIINIFKSLHFLSEIIKNTDLSIVNAGVNSKVEYFPKVHLQEELNYNEKEVEEIFSKLIKDFCGEDIESFPLIKENCFDLDEKISKFKVKLDYGLTLIKILAGIYIPLGPYGNQYYFVKNHNVNE